MRKIINALLITSFALLITTAGAAFASESAFLSGMDGSEVVPPTASPATGHGSLFLNAAQTQVTFYVEIQNLPDETACHFHMAAMGDNGPVVFTLPSGPVKTGTWNVTPAEAQALLDGNIYIQAHSTEYPGGAIRGQVTFCAVPVENLTFGSIKAIFQ